MEIPIELLNYFDAVDDFNQKALQHKKESLRQLLKWFSDKKSKKVNYARAGIKDRYHTLSYKEQITVLNALFDGGVSDRKWAYSRITVFVSKHLIEKVQSLFEKFNEKEAGYLIIRYSSLEFVKEHAKELEQVVAYRQFCMKMAQDSEFSIDKSKLLPEEYLYIMAKNKKMVELKDVEVAIWSMIIRLYLYNQNDYISHFSSMDLENWTCRSISMIYASLDYEIGPYPILPFNL